MLDICRYGEGRVVLVGSPELRAHALIPADAVPCLSRLSDVQYCVLEVIGEARRHGIFRTLLTNKYLKNDPRSTFHHVKVLKKFGLITTKVCAISPCPLVCLRIHALCTHLCSCANPVMHLIVSIYTHVYTIHCIQLYGFVLVIAEVDSANPIA